MNTTIREGQVNQSIETIRQICGYSVPLTLMQNIVPTVLRTCVKANMVIDQTTTEEARRCASEDVEPVVYLQGQNIIRDGEVVSVYQYQLLASLGLLEGAETDLTIYAGALLSVLGAMVLYIMLQLLLDRKLFRDLRRTSVSMLVIVLDVALCSVIGEMTTPYAAPSAMVAMLITGLLGWKASIPAGVCTSVLVGCLAACGNNSSSS